MSGGSWERQSPRDCQCENCGLWFDSAGVKSHESTCDYPEDRDPLVGLEAPEDAPDLEEVADLAADVVDQEASDDVDPTPTEDAGEEIDAMANASSDPTAVTDGGVAELPTPDGSTPTPDVDDVDQEASDDVDANVHECPNCGTHRVYPVDELPGWVLEAVPALREMDYVCDDETSIRRGTVEAFPA